MNGLEHVLFEPLMAVFGQVWQDLDPPAPVEASEDRAPSEVLRS